MQGAAGGVGTALLELGGLADLEWYGTASRYDHGVVAALGATPIDYRADDVVARIRALTGDGVDVVFGGAARRALRPAGAGALLSRPRTAGRSTSRRGRR